MKTYRLIYRPTIASLRKELDDLVESGWHEDQQIQISQMVNGPEAFSIEAVERWLGATS